MQTRALGRTGLHVTPICVGTSALGNFPSQYGYEVSTGQAVLTMLAVLKGPFNFVDTSNEYGNGGDSERRIGQALAAVGGVPDGFVIATKVDPLVGSLDFFGDRVRASVEESLQRLGLDRLQLVYFHDPEKISFEEGMAKGGAVEALVRLREEKVIDHLGIAGGPIDLMLRYVQTDIFEVVISHNRFTLVDQSAEPLLSETDRRGIGFVNAAPFGGGMLVQGSDRQPKYCYAEASPRTIERVREMERLCDSFGVSLAAAALQFSLREPRVASTIVGMSDPRRIAQTSELASVDVPDELWTRLRPLIEEGRNGIV
jgi:D-threo-aldose 1-dehydrogenase